MQCKDLIYLKINSAKNSVIGLNESKTIKKGKVNTLPFYHKDQMILVVVTTCTVYVTVI